ncbi:hypothetical protein [Clostridium sp. 'White wine YQ']|uniref:hypothetical protein n=1 Tax=Clostridium sp. 'White wine YQ' TaxID=3027474 RepID=UPI002366B192|nr:hypothetical protein [Clostridium sp. 'White wine YQ']MDD7792664.1 hypothetical protein [Clostridium sp. 'White wine YQ']
MRFLTLEQYLNNRDVLINKEEFDSTSTKLKKEDVYSQLDIINEIHRILSEYPYDIIPTVPSRIGEDFEEFKVLYRKVSRAALKGYYPEHIKDEVYKILLNAEKAINHIDNSSYLSILRRAMDNGEIILGNCDFRHLKYNDKIIINSVKGVCYNIIESDYGKFLMKLRKYNVVTSYGDFIDHIVKNEKLQDNSKIFLMGYILYPQESMKLLQKYKEGKKQWNEETFYYKFMKAYEFDNSITI